MALGRPLLQVRSARGIGRTRTYRRSAGCPVARIRTLRPSRAPEAKGDKRHEDRRCYHAADGEPANGIYAQLAATARRPSETQGKSSRGAMFGDPHGS
jgi:hypothetical protein